MKAVLEFDLPEDQDAFRLASNASEMFSFLWRTRETIRRQHKDDGLDKWVWEIYYDLNSLLDRLDVG